jgi:hypothetical protein
MKPPPVLLPTRHDLYRNHRLFDGRLLLAKISFITNSAMCHRSHACFQTIGSSGATNSARHRVAIPATFALSSAREPAGRLSFATCLSTNLSRGRNLDT